MFQKRTTGSVVAYALVIMTTVSILLTSILGFVVSQVNYSLHNQSRESALQVAEAGIHFYKWYLAHQLDGRTATQVRDFWAAGTALGQSAPYTAVYVDPSGTTVGSYRITVTPPTSGSTIVLLQSEGWSVKHPDVIRTISVRLRKPSWSEYMALSNSMIRFGNGTEIFGKVHSNSGFHLEGTMHNTGSSAVTTYFDTDSDVNATKPGVWTGWIGEYNTDMGADVFQGGKSFPVAAKDFNGVSADMSYMKSEAQGGVYGRYFDNSGQGRHIILKTNDTFDIRTVSSAVAATNAINNYSGGWATYPIPQDGVIYVEGHVWIEGQINTARVTIVAANLISASNKSLYINGNLRYTNYDGRDVIGLVGQQNVDIVRDSPANLTLDAAIIAQQGSFSRTNYAMGCACGNAGCKALSVKDTITMHGAFATNGRYGLYVGGSCSRNSGYPTRNLYYDNNLLYSPPPYFPVGTQYVIDLWEEL